MTEQQLSQYPEEVSRTTEPEEIWRNEVQDRLARYKRRRGRRIEGAYTMRFPFPAEEATEPVPLAPEEAPAEEPAIEQTAAAAQAGESAEFQIAELDPSAREFHAAEEVAEEAVWEPAAARDDLVLQAP